jgi:oxygen-independent coproporphyrinogen III oxidase
MKERTSLGPFGVYLHFPFCRSKCGYSDFASVATEEIPQERYARFLLRELSTRAESYAAGELCSIYVGGGTPSLWDPGELARVLDDIRRTFVSCAEPEITLEINPGGAGVSLERLIKIGINRLSVGVQSLDDEMLRLLTRIHDGAEARTLVLQARRVGFTNINCDLIFGLPGQTLSHHLEQLRRLLELRPTHISTYALSLSEKAPLRRAGFAPADPDLQAEMMEAGRELLEEAGYPQYEVSNFAPEAYRSVHNTLTWAGRPYLGLGASAHSMCAEGSSTLRVANPPWPDYLEAPLLLDAWLVPIVQGSAVEILDGHAARFEMIFLGLRTVEGLDRRAYRERFDGDPLDHFGSSLLELFSHDLISLGEDRIAPTRRGIWFADELALRLLT